MTRLADHNLSPAIEPAAKSLTVWGYSAPALHDLFWLSREVAIVRPGGGKAIDCDARLFMLVPERKLFRLHLRLVLDQLFWMPRSLYFIGFYPPTRRPPSAESQSSSHGAAAGAITGMPQQPLGNNCGTRPEPAARAALTPRPKLPVTILFALTVKRTACPIPSLTARIIMVLISFLRS